MREIRVAALPKGLPKAEHFIVAEVPRPEPRDGEVLVRNIAFHVFAAIRTMLGGLSGGPFPPLNVGDTLFGAAVGEVVAGSLPPGTLVFHLEGWREYAAVPAAACRILDDSFPDPIQHLGYGPLALAALERDAALRQGDTVFVSGGAGGVGSAAGQIARLLGAGRVVGSTSSATKAPTMTSELGYDAVVLRGSPDIEADLAKAAPDGIDVMIDNIGGEQLRAAAALARTDARFVLIGALSGQLDPEGSGTTSPVTLDTQRLILRRVTLRGFGGATGPEATARLGDWLRSGELVLPETRFQGIESAPRALQELIEGAHLGTVIVEL
jgi:NADPH-dependent curcumin reductase CurA